jgi:hypothetical protein
MKSAPAWVLYTVYRILLFAVPLVILLVLQIVPWLATLLAAIIGLCLSYILLRSPREKVALDLYAATHRTEPVVHTDDESEDAAVDRAETNRVETEQARSDRARTEQARTDRSEGERSAEQDAVSEPGETGEFQGEDKLR